MVRVEGAGESGLDPRRDPHAPSSHAVASPTRPILLFWLRFWWIAPLLLLFAVLSHTFRPCFC